MDACNDADAVDGVSAKSVAAKGWQSRGVALMGDAGAGKTATIRRLMAAASHSRTKMMVCNRDHELSAFYRPGQDFLLDASDPGLSMSPCFVTDWIIGGAADSRLFITFGAGSEHALVVQIQLAMATLTAMARLGACPQSDYPHLLFVVDDLDRLPRIDGLDLFMAQARKYGIVPVVSASNPAVLNQHYGDGFFDDLHAAAVFALDVMWDADQVEKRPERPLQVQYAV